VGELTHELLGLLVHLIDDRQARGEIGKNFLEDLCYLLCLRVDRQRLDLV